MERLLNYFQSASLCPKDQRKLGIEIETLFINKQNKKPISLETSQNIFSALVAKGWKIVSKSETGFITGISLANKWFLGVDLGWNNFELTTPATEETEFCWEELAEVLRMIYSVADKFGAEPLFSPYDGCCDINTLMLPDKRDQIWIELDGQEPLQVLGHIACVHFNIDLTSIEEGMNWINKLNLLFYAKIITPKNPLVWQHNQIWWYYIRKSFAKYESERYGYPPVGSISDYCLILSLLKVVMNKKGNNIYKCNPPFAFMYTPDPDIDLFLRSVWWYSRLRVRNGKLTIEIRNVPRFQDRDIKKHFNIIKEILDL